MLFRLFASAALLLASVSMAQAQEMPADLQTQLQKLQEMPPEGRAALAHSLSESAAVLQECIESAGGAEALDDLRDLHNAHQTQVARLCSDDKRKEAQAYAEQTARELSQDRRVAALHECSRVATQNMPQLNQLLENGGIDTSKHVCD